MARSVTISTDMKPAKELGERVRQVRNHRGLSLRGLAKSAGLSHSLLKKLEAGTVSPAVDKVSRIAEALQVRTAFLVGEEDTRLAINVALARQSLRIYLSRNSNPLPLHILWKAAHVKGAPDTVELWERQMAVLSAVKDDLRTAKHEQEQQRIVELLDYLTPPTGRGHGALVPHTKVAEPGLLYRSGRAKRRAVRRGVALRETSK